jgi:hypothetical protein
MELLAKNAIPQDTVDIRAEIATLDREGSGTGSFSNRIAHQASLHMLAPNRRVLATETGRGILRLILDQEVYRIYNAKKVGKGIVICAVAGWPSAGEGGG